MAEVRVRANALLQDAAEPSLDRIAGTLRELGVGGHATEAFCALVRTTQATAGELVRKTGIPEPKTYRMVPPKEIELRISRMVQAKYELGRAAAVRIASLLEPLQAATKAPATDLAYIVKGLPNIAIRASSLIER